MRIRDVTILLAAGALGLAGCGGAARTATTTRVASNEPTAHGGPAATSGSSTPATTATSSGSTRTARRSTSSKPARTASAPEQRPHRSPAARSPRRRSSATFNPNAIQEAVAKAKAEHKREGPAVLTMPHVPAKSARSKPAAVACMHYGGLFNVARRGNGTWVGTDPSNAQLLYVAGPYPNAPAASALAKSLGRRENARSGGLYVAFATFRSALSGELRTVSRCLAHGGPKRTLVF